jgi:hypothetical protein
MIKEFSAGFKFYICKPGTTGAIAIHRQHIHAAITLDHLDHSKGSSNDRVICMLRNGKNFIKLVIKRLLYASILPYPQTVSPSISHIEAGAEAILPVYGQKLLIT